MTNSLTKDLEYGKIAQTNIGKTVAEKLFGEGAVALNTKTYASVDFAVYKAGELVGFVEYKRRRCSSTAYATTICSEDKYLAAQALSKIFRLKTYLLVEFDDAVGYADLTKEPVRYEDIKRYDREKGKKHCHYKIEVWLETEETRLAEKAAEISSSENTSDNPLPE